MNMLAPYIYQVKVELQEIEPLIWRRLQIPADLFLHDFHKVLQTTMGWENQHMHVFIKGKRFFGQGDIEWNKGTLFQDYTIVRVNDLLRKPGDEMIYHYDFGDDWRHSVVVEEVVAADPMIDYPRFVDGARRGPPEDVGGLPGFEEFLGATADPKHPEHDSVMTWYGHPFDPTDIDLDAITARLAKLARRRAQGKAGFEKSRNRIN